MKILLAEDDACHSRRLGVRKDGQLINLLQDTLLIDHNVHIKPAGADSNLYK